MVLRLSLLCLFLPTFTWAEGIRWQAWSPQVFQQAGAEGRLVLLDITAQWCAFCRKMDRDTYTDPRVTALIRDHYLAVRMDEAAFPEFVARYPDSRPLTLVFDAQGRELVRKAGYLRPQWMRWLLQAMLEAQP